MASPPTLGDSLRRIRKRNGLSQTSLAERVGVSQVTVSAWEVGTVDMPATKAVDVMRQLGCRPQDLFGPLLEDEPQDDPLDLARRLVEVLERDRNYSHHA